MEQAVDWSAFPWEALTQIPLSLVLLWLLREQFSRFDKFLEVLQQLRRTVSKNTHALELLQQQNLLIRSGDMSPAEILQAQQQLRSTWGEDE